MLGHIAQWVTCLTTDARLTADPVVVSSIPAWSHTFVEFDNEIISSLILLPSTDPCEALQAFYLLTSLVNHSYTPRLYSQWLNSVIY